LQLLSPVHTGDYMVAEFDDSRRPVAVFGDSRFSDVFENTKLRYVRTSETKLKQNSTENDAYFCSSSTSVVWTAYAKR